MFGGQAELYGSALTDTWAWDGKGWTQLHPARIPPPVDCTSCAFMAFDQAAGQMVMVEDTAQGVLTWTWSGDNWTQQHPSHGSFGGPITYDAALRKVLNMATWAWDGSDWAHIPTAHSVDSYLCCLTYDAATRQVLYLGSIGKSFESQSVQTWIFDGQDWALSSAPTILGTLVAMVEYPPISKVLLVGGRIDNPSSGATWAWDGKSWQRLAAASPPVLTNFSLAYDGQHQEVVLFGGIDPYNNGVSDTWVWDGHTWTKRKPPQGVAVSAFGQQQLATNVPAITPSQMPRTG